MHRYVRPGVYTVRVECAAGHGGSETGDISAKTEVVIGGHVSQLRDLTCHSGDLLSAEEGCTALLGRPLEVRMNGLSGKRALECPYPFTHFHPIIFYSIRSFCLIHFLLPPIPISD